MRDKEKLPKLLARMQAWLKKMDEPVAASIMVNKEKEQGESNSG